MRTRTVALAVVLTAVALLSTACSEESSSATAAPSTVAAQRVNPLVEAAKLDPSSLAANDTRGTGSDNPTQVSHTYRFATAPAQPVCSETLQNLIDDKHFTPYVAVYQKPERVATPSDCTSGNYDFVDIRQTKTDQQMARMTWQGDTVTFATTAAT